VLDVGEGAELLLEAQQRVGLEGAKGLERDGGVALAIDGLVPTPMPPAPRRRTTSKRSVPTKSSPVSAATRR
jgi:hypothetical protein